MANRSTPKPTTMSPSVYLTEPTFPPRAAPGCDECASLRQERVEAHAAGDNSRVSDLSVQIKRHPRHGKKRG